jgi:spore coat protein A, manganese oxidase
VYPVHLHLADAQLIDRNGQPPRPFKRGRKDVFLMGEMETLRIAVQFRKDPIYAGKFMMHCHQLFYADNGMMSQVELGKGGLDPMATAPTQRS